MRDFEDFTGKRYFRPARCRLVKAVLLGSVALVLSVGLGLAAFVAPELPRSALGGLLGGKEDGSGDASAQTPGGEETEPVNILLMGLDGRETAAEGGQSARTDTLMLARVDPETGDATLLSIPRDLFVEDVTPGGDRDRINSAYAYGGADKTVEVVEGFTGVPVDHHVVADFDGFEEVVDSLGGVEVDVQGDYLAHKDIPAGEQVLDGEEALLYARYRKTPTGDLGRIERQQELLSALKSQTLSLDSLGSVPGVVRSLNENVETDMGVREMVSLGRPLAENGRDGGLESGQLQGRPYTLPDGREVLLPDDGSNEEVLQESIG